MNTNKTISVEPGKITLAERKNRERAAEYFRTSILNSETQKIEKINLSKLLFPTQKSANLSFVKYSVPLRSIFSALLIIFGINAIHSSGLVYNHNLSLGILSIIFGGFLGIGLFSRITMALATSMFAITGIIGLRMGIQDMTSFSMMFGSMIFLIMGSGKYSCDTFLRKIMWKRMINKRNQMRQEALSYKAFSCLSRNI